MLEIEYRKFFPKASRLHFAFGLLIFFFFSINRKEKQKARLRNQIGKNITAISSRMILIHLKGGL